MPLQQAISNPGGAFGLPLSGTNLAGSAVMSNDVVAIEMLNNTTTNRTYGDVVVTDVTGLLATTTTSAGDVTVAGVVGQYGVGNPGSTGATFATLTPMPVVIKGVARVNIGAGTVATGALLVASATAGVATVSATPATGSTIGVALESSTVKDTNNTIRVKLTTA
jgi:hypothetical protein